MFGELNDNLSQMFKKNKMMPLFATPREILGHHSEETEKAEEPSILSEDYHVSGGTPQETRDGIEDLMDKKATESGDEFWDSIKTHGVQVPINISAKEERSYLTGQRTGGIGQLTIGNGHHRLAAAFVHRPDDLIPIRYNSNDSYDLATQGEQEGLPKYRH